MPRREKFSFSFSDTDRVIVTFGKQVSGKNSEIIDFSVVYEIKIASINEWIVVVRYDSEHMTHSDRVSRKVHKHQCFPNKPDMITVFPIQNKKEALTSALNDLKNNWPTYKITYEGEK